ncbi:uncharacterized protein [Choristoneura fumiferana]|uniref:uncharacterized protein n=1 Tax=Choristoneura fumiferana TaxID=7141 RepID=UPI003D1573A5
MNYTFNMESVLIALTTVLCATLVLNLLHKLRLSLPWRVNCWFCNSNFWWKFVERNSWVCPKCEQYNGFTKDGDYNKPLISASNDSANKPPRSPKVFQKSPPKNGLCKMCNVNLQLKVAQLANFVPMNERNYDNEIEDYKMQLEKAYKLCSPCRKVLQKKLHKEKEVLLGSKVLETRSPEKKNLKHEKRSSLLKAFINKTSMFIAGVLVLLVCIECYVNTKKNDLPVSIMNLKDILFDVLDRVLCIAKMKFVLTFPSLENYSINLNKYYEILEMKLNMTNLSSFEQTNDVTQKTLGAFVCLIQIIGHIWNVNELKYTILIDLLWSVFVMVSVANEYVAMEPFYIRLVKLTSVLAVLVVYKNLNAKINIPAKFQPGPKKIKSLQNGTSASFFDDDSDVVMESDDDVSLSKFGLHNFTDSSADTVSPLSTSMLNGRSFTPRIGDSIWSKPKLNTTFCVNSVRSKSPSSVSETVFIKPSFSKYQDLTKGDSDSDLDESISSLCISSPKKASKKGNSVFSLRKFTATPSFVAPAPRARPLISPSKLGHGTSWVAGGYWGADGERPLCSVDGSRSSSQSSGFESQASSANQRAAPPSRDDSVCGDGGVLDRFQQCGTASYSSYPSPQNFGRVGSPVFPQMQYNGHVQIPQARAVFPAQRPLGPFRPPGATGLINLSRLNSYAR